MDLLEGITGRRSIRRFLPKTIPYKILFDILDAATYAPTAGNLHTTRFVVIESDELKSKLRLACSEQDWIEDAPIIIAVCSMDAPLKRMFGSRGEELYSIQNTAVATENILLAAQHYKIQGTWVGAFSEADVRTVLHIPEKIGVHALITLGYPDETPRKLPKNEITNMTYYEQWGNTNKASKLIPLGESPAIKQASKRAKKRAKTRKDKFIDKFEKTIKRFK
tara:strand:+ start:2286 stop:2951 length:666 start_codon:yes stop_codon:yes gene_type:complete